MKFTFLTLFPHLISGYFEDSILKRAVLNNLIDIEIINIRDFSQNKYKKVDDFQVGGGAGLVLCADILSRALETVITKNSHIIYLTPVAKSFVQNDAKRIAALYSHIIFICGRYEGIDERIIENLAAADVELTDTEFAAIEAELAKIKIYGNRTDADIAKLRDM